MTEKKIGTCIKVLVNVGNYQNIEIAKYAENTINYETKDEMVEKENQQTQELLASLKRDLAKTPEELGKYEDKVEDFNRSVTNQMPKWLGEGVIPNIANRAKALKETSDAKNEEKINDKNNVVAEFDSLINDKEESPKSEPKDTKNEDNEDNLFGDDDDLFDD